MMSQTASFLAKLAPLSCYLNDPAMTELVINRPGEVWILSDRERYMRCISMPSLTYEWALSLAQLIAFTAGQEIHEDKPILSAVMPYQALLYRVQIIRPPALERDHLALCIRKSSVSLRCLADYMPHQLTANTDSAAWSENEVWRQLRVFYHQKDWAAFLRMAVRLRLNIMISAGTNAGKTSLLNVLLKEASQQERIVTIEDTRELFPAQKNCVHLLYSRGGAAPVTPVDLLEGVLRLSPDRIVMGELRGAEAYVYLELLNSGHTGSLSTIHADCPELMFERLAQMVMRFNPHYTKTHIIDYAKSLIQVVVQCSLNDHGERVISDIWYRDALSED